MTTNKPEEQQFKTIYEESHGALQRFLFRLTRNREDTDDLLQETFLRLFEHSLTSGEEKKECNGFQMKVFHYSVMILHLN